MAVFRRRVVYRDNRETSLLGSLIIVAASAAGSLVFGGSGLATTPVVLGDAAPGSIVLAGGPILAATVENPAFGTIAFTGNATGLNVSPASGSGSIVLAGTGRSSQIAVGSIVFSGSGTVGSIFLGNASGSIVFAGSAISTDLANSGAGSVVFSGSALPGLSGGTIVASAVGPIDFSGLAMGADGLAVAGEITFSGSALASRLTVTHTPPWRTCVIKREFRR